MPAEEPETAHLPSDALENSGLRMPVASFRKVVKKYSKNPNEAAALDTLSLEIQPGEAFALVGPNGSGKSTAIKILLSLVHPDAG
jgi:ABC-type multidrug transport system ATPase subunit